MNAIIPRNRCDGWTEVEYATIERMAKEGANDDAIAKVVGRTRWAVRKARHRIGVFTGSKPAAPWSDAEFSTMRTMFYEGASDEQIAKALNRSPKAVQEQRKDVGLVRREGASRPTTRNRPCPVDAEEEERIRACEAYLDAAERAGHRVYKPEELPALYRARAEA